MSTKPFSAQEYGLIYAFLILSISVAASVDLMVSWIGSIALLLLLVTIISTVAATGIGKNLNAVRHP